MASRIRKIITENSREANILEIIEEIRQDGGFTSEFLRNIFHGWLSSSFCDDAEINTRSNYYSYFLDLANLLDCINGIERLDDSGIIR